jgi:hypothetical protein
VIGGKGGEFSLSLINTNEEVSSLSLNGIHSRNMLTKKKLMKGVKKVISILVRIINITRMKLLMLPKAKKPDHFACKMGLQTNNSPYTTKTFS